MDATKRYHNQRLVRLKCDLFGEVIDENVDDGFFLILSEQLLVLLSLELGYNFSGVIWNNRVTRWLKVCGVFVWSLWTHRFVFPSLFLGMLLIFLYFIMKSFNHFCLHFLQVWFLYLKGFISYSYSSMVLLKENWVPFLALFKNIHRIIKYGF